MRFRALSWPEVLALRKYRVLFLVLLVYLVVYPYVQNNGSEYLGFRLFACLVTLFSVYAVSIRKGIMLGVIALALPTLTQHLIVNAGNVTALALLVTISGFLFDLVIVVIIFRRVFAMGEPNSEAIFGALCIYLLVGFSFANGYLFLAGVQPRAFYFDPAAHFPPKPGRFAFIYYSFGTMTSLGAPGVTPASDQARSISIIQAILGVLYLAVMIARLMGLYKSPLPKDRA